VLPIARTPSEINAIGHVVAAKLRSSCFRVLVRNSVPKQNQNRNGD
jgi:hypothetical protein